MIDTHCHLADRKFSTDLPDVLARAQSAGVEKMICIGDSLEESERCVKLAQKYPQLFCSVGVHPHHAKNWREGDVQKLEDLTISSSKVVAIGEIGLDYHYDFSPREQQKAVFEAQLRLANDLQLPAVVHTRQSIGDLKDIIAKVKPSKLVLHCCTEHWEDVEELVEAGYFLSFTGIATFPSSKDIRGTMRRCPLSQLMLETDAPYLAPIPHRGSRNEPAFVAEVCKLVAHVKEISGEEVEKATTENAVRFFGLED